jgi:hypothetical protein
MEHAMTVATTFRRTLMTTAMLAVLALGGARGAAAETDIFKDVLVPNGHVRGMTAKRADMRTCGAVNGQVRAEDFPRSKECMREHGWVIDHVVQDAPDRDSHGTVVHFDDLRKKPSGDWRGDGALQADTRRCGGRKATDYESQDFKQCMLGRGWQFAFTTHAPGASGGRQKAGQEKTWQEYDDDGVLVTCHAILGGFGSVCSNF